MVAVVFSNLVSYRIMGRSLFDFQLERKGIDLSAGRDRARLVAVRVSEFATDDFPGGGPEERAADVLARLDRENWREAFIRDGDGRYVGKLKREGSAVPGDAAASELLEPPGLEFTERTSMREALEALGGYDGDGVPVISSRDRRLLGVVTKSALIRAYLGEVDAIRAEENAPG